MKKNIIIVLLIITVVTISLLLSAQTTNKSRLAGLEILAEDLEQRVVSRTVHVILTDPSLLFSKFGDHPEWEKIEAVPYSQCYRHLIGTTTYDYIVCKAI